MSAGKSSTLLLFGATGDLARRMLLPSLYALHADKLLPPALEVVATARSVLDDDAFRAGAIEALAEHVPAPMFDRATAAAFARRLSYVPLDATVAGDFARLAERMDSYAAPASPVEAHAAQRQLDASR